MEEGEISYILTSQPVARDPPRSVSWFQGEKVCTQIMKKYNMCYNPWVLLFFKDRVMTAGL